MKRKEFLRRSVQAGACCGVTLLVDSASGVTPQESNPAPPLSACEKKVAQGQDVIRRLIQQLDAKLDQGTREGIMECCGQACYEGAHGKRSGKTPTPEEVSKFLEGMRKYLGADGVKQVGDETLVYFKYTSNPEGLKTADGYCLCPILENAPKDIPATYCHCSVGYVREIFERGTGKPATVQLTETVLRGGKACRFTISFKT